MIWSDYTGVAERFEKYVDRSGTCHLWTSKSTAGGKTRAYGSFHVAYPVRRMEYAHRLEMIRKLGRELAPGEMVMHSCDTPLCVNPDHLLIGDQGKNMADAASRGRVMRGERHVFARLTEQKVKEIRALGAVAGTRHEDIAALYGVSRTAVTLVLQRKRWAHVQESPDRMTPIP